MQHLSAIYLRLPFFINFANQTIGMSENHKDENW